MLRGELDWIAGVELGRFVELGVRQPRRVGAQSANAAHPGFARPNGVREMTRVRAVDHEIRGIPFRRLVHRLDRRPQYRSRGQRRVRLDRERDRHRHPRRGRGPGHPDRLLGVRHGDGADHVGCGPGERSNLLGVVVLRLVGRHRGVDGVSVSPRADASADDDGRPVALVVPPNGFEQRDRLPVRGGELVAGVPDAETPVRVRAPGRTLEHQTQAAPACHLGIRVEIPAQRRRPVRRPQERERRELGKVQAFVENQGRLDPTVRQEEVASELRQGVSVPCHVVSGAGAIDRGAGPRPSSSMTGFRRSAAHVRRSGVTRARPEPRSAGGARRRGRHPVRGRANRPRVPRPARGRPPSGS